MNLLVYWKKSTYKKEISDSHFSYGFHSPSPKMGKIKKNEICWIFTKVDTCYVLAAMLVKKNNNSKSNSYPNEHIVEGDKKISKYFELSQQGDQFEPFLRTNMKNISLSNKELAFSFRGKNHVKEIENSLHKQLQKYLKSHCKKTRK